MRTIRSAKEARDGGVLRLYREEGADDEVLGEAKRTNAEELNNELQRVLTSEQLETFQSRYGGGKGN